MQQALAEHDVHIGDPGQLRADGLVVPEEGFYRIDVSRLIERRDPLCSPQPSFTNGRLVFMGRESRFNLQLQHDQEHAGKRRVRCTGSRHVDDALLESDNRSAGDDGDVIQQSHHAASPGVRPEFESRLYDVLAAQDAYGIAGAGKADGYVRQPLVDGLQAFCQLHRIHLEMALVQLARFPDAQAGRFTPFEAECHFRLLKSEAQRCICPGITLSRPGC